MAIESAPYYYARCDECGERAEYDEFTAFETQGQAADLALDEEWTTKDGLWHCPGCPPLEVEE